MLNLQRKERREGWRERGTKETGKRVTFRPAAGPFPGPEGCSNGGHQRELARTSPEWLAHRKLWMEGWRENQGTDPFSKESRQKESMGT